MTHIPTAQIALICCRKCRYPLHASRWGMPYCEHCKLVDASKDVRKLAKPGVLHMPTTIPLTGQAKAREMRRWRYFIIALLITAAFIIPLWN